MTTLAADRYRLASRMKTLEPSPFLAVLQAARKVEAQGRNVIYLSMGEPDFATPEHVKQAGIQAIQRGETRYAAMDGTVQLKDAICRKLLRDNRLTYQRNQITVTAGGTQAIFNTMLATVGPGDEVILPAPFFQPYVSAILLCGATPVVLPTREEEGFVPRAKRIAEVITEKTRWLILNSPSNPAGAVIDRTELADIAALLRQHLNVLVFSDDIYESIYYGDDPLSNIVNVAPDLADRTLILNGISKAYAMTGWRIGYLAGPEPLVAAVSQVTATSTFTASTIAQAAAVEALDGTQESLVTQNAAYRNRRDLLVRKVNQIPGLHCRAPDGAFYLFINCSHFVGRCTLEGALIDDDLAFVLHLLNHSGLASVQGSAFGMPGFIRIAYAASEETLNDAADRLAAACAALR
ncbi:MULTISPECIES: pyridoxal phosphate-dependent aminotransferase [unclassified Variovorax]|uniref:pyridoxal phosphate-dependent aminotransferase n=1 Tax=unclassified Variovorax TaxID=663243 RepID=UPI0032E71F71